MQTQEAQEAGESAMDALKQRVFASAFGSFAPNERLAEYYRHFEDEPRPPTPEEVEEFVPESEEDLQRMFAAAFRAGVISPSAGD